MISGTYNPQKIYKYPNYKTLMSEPINGLLDKRPKNPPINIFGIAVIGKNTPASVKI